MISVNFSKAPCGCCVECGLQRAKVEGRGPVRSCCSVHARDDGGLDLGEASVVVRSGQILDAFS